MILAITFQAGTWVNLFSLPHKGKMNRFAVPAPTRFGLRHLGIVRDSIAGTLKFTSSLVSPSFKVANTVVNGIHPKPGQFTGGEGPTTGQEVLISVDFTTPILLDPNHYF